MNKRVMLEHCTMVLSNVSFDPNLFYKELKKAVGVLLPYDVEELMDWLKNYLEEQPLLKEKLGLLDEEILNEFAFK